MRGQNPAQRSCGCRISPADDTRHHDTVGDTRPIGLTEDFTGPQCRFRTGAKLSGRAASPADFLCGNGFWMHGPVSQRAALNEASDAEAWQVRVVR
ncbi:hypothetical protein OG203_17535 [Nocardia sp. NBC_01499]|uniref:hypothetical protein n=1 Tax=Nocardia sp. NBC_01499 TaxID=2903597 RepID=UPI00386F87A7